MDAKTLGTKIKHLRGITENVILPEHGAVSLKMQFGKYSLSACNMHKMITFYVNDLGSMDTDPILVEPRLFDFCHNLKDYNISINVDPKENSILFKTSSGKYKGAIDKIGGFSTDMHHSSPEMNPVRQFTINLNDLKEAFNICENCVSKDLMKLSFTQVLITTMPGTPGVIKFVASDTAQMVFVRKPGVIHTDNHETFMCPVVKDLGIFQTDDLITVSINDSVCVFSSEDAELVVRRENVKPFDYSVQESRVQVSANTIKHDAFLGLLKRANIFVDFYVPFAKFRFYDNKMTVVVEGEDVGMEETQDCIFSGDSGEITFSVQLLYAIIKDLKNELLYISIDNGVFSLSVLEGDIAYLLMSVRM